MSPITQATTVARKMASQVRGLQRTLTRPPGGPISSQEIDELLQGWPATAAIVAMEMRERYGEPHEVTPERLVWHQNRPWKRTQVLRDEIAHRFPAAHADFLVQTVGYRVPPEKFSELARFNGSIVADRTAGELTAHCDDEAMNILGLNLAHEIITGDTTVDEARQVYAEEAAAYAVNPPTPYTERLLFDIPLADPADFDEPAVEGAIERRTGERMTDLTPAS